MTRRYLSNTEAKTNLNRGKSVECFIGGCGNDNQGGIEWFSISKVKEGYLASIYQTADLGSDEYFDVYSFGPLNENLDYEDADELLRASSFEQVLVLLEQRFKRADFKLVNQFVIQDEYLDYIRNGRVCSI